MREKDLEHSADRPNAGPATSGDLHRLPADAGSGLLERRRWLGRAERRFQHQGDAELPAAKNEIGRDAEPRDEQDRHQPRRRAGGGAALAHHARDEDERHSHARNHR
jgi:hypothetical protein